MKSAWILSVVLHAFLFLAVLALPQERRLTVSERVIPVELVQMPRPAVQSDTREEKPVLSPSPDPVITKKPVRKAREAGKTEKAAPVSEDTVASRPAPGSTVRIGTENFPFSYYLGLIRFRVEENWFPPYQQLEQGEKMNAIVAFRIMRNGQVDSILLERSSDRFLFDQAAQRAIISIGQLPPLPEEFQGDYVTIHIEFEAAW